MTIFELLTKPLPPRKDAPPAHNPDPGQPLKSSESDSSIVSETVIEPEPHVLAPSPAAPLEVDGVQVVYCTTYPEAEALIAEVIQDAAGKPVALDLETAPIRSERERLAAAHRRPKESQRPGDRLPGDREKGRDAAGRNRRFHRQD